MREVGAEQSLVHSAPSSTQPAIILFEQLYATLFLFATLHFTERNFKVRRLRIKIT